MQTFVVDCEFSTHDDLKNGVCALGFHRFQILADDDVTATLVAAQWVSALGFMPTRTMVHV